MTKLALENITLSIDDDVYDHIVGRCVKKETGARGLHSLMTEALEDACFEAYSSKRKKRVIHLFIKDGRIESETGEDNGVRRQ